MGGREMLNYQISGSSLAKLEEQSIPVESDYDDHFIICIRNDGQGINIIEARTDFTQDIPIHKDYLPILKEAIWIWEHYNGSVKMSVSDRRIPIRDDGRKRRRKTEGECREGTGKRLA
jgi:hypothetical protein